MSPLVEPATLQQMLCNCCSLNSLHSPGGTSNSSKNSTKGSSCSPMGGGSMIIDLLPLLLSGCCSCSCSCRTSSIVKSTFRLYESGRLWPFIASRVLPENSLQSTALNSAVATLYCQFGLTSGQHISLLGSPTSLHPLSLSAFICIHRMG